MPQFPEKLARRDRGERSQTHHRMQTKPDSSPHADAGPYRVAVVGETVISEQGMATLVAGDKRYLVCGAAHTVHDANNIIRQHRPDVLLIEPFLEHQDGIRWIKDLARELPRTRILIVSRQAEQIYAERALRAGASGYWMKNSSAPELMRAIAVVLSGEIYVSPLIASRAVQQFAGRKRSIPGQLEVLSDRELAVFSLLAAERRIGEIGQELGISRRTVESHCENIKAKLGHADAEALRRGAHELLGAAHHSGRHP
jgi:DNA-binding NarL/FixJ family response regulator